MSAGALALAFFDPARRRYGTLRAGVTLLFEDRTPTALATGAEMSEAGDEYRAVLEDRVDLTFTALSDQVSLAGERWSVCRVAGSVDGTPIDGLGTVSDTRTPPAWAELDATRSVSAVFDPDHAVLAVARRPRGTMGHGQELVSAALLSGGELLAVEETRLSTVYDGDGRQRTIGLELWRPGEDFPRRASGEVLAGTTLDLPGLQVNAAVFDWRMEGREGVGAYDVTIRAESPTAA